MKIQDHRDDEARTPRRLLEAVLAPSGHQGVGAALRSAFLPRLHDRPADMTELLDRMR